ncbi:MAG TPA: GspE/PulE family protein [Geminicoccus sp.]|uniref:GspE/PulE family protein n=1 Tax=Geminicoccus sp. TaxID=2024832 RepID=UPI002E34B249|nr:GspE/PulE family protein [Geminicoccus sp.]HEX2528719.1 GspE/PulE family protein [Geminicoccus sp.]
MDLILTRLVEAGRLGVADVARVREQASMSAEPLPALLAKSGLMTPSSFARAMADLYDIEMVSADALPKEPVFPGQLAGRFLEANRALPIRYDDHTVWLAMADPTNSAAMRAVTIATKRRVVPVVVPYDELDRAIAKAIRADAPSLDQIGRDAAGGEVLDQLPDDKESLEHQAEAAPVIRFVNQMLSDAARMSASDIHVEPARDRLRVRFRVHGRLREIGAPPARLAAAVISRIKIMARLDIAERRLPQDGRARVLVDQRRFDLRVATAPSVHGESVVIRLLETDKDAPSFVELGMPPAIEAAIRRQLAAPHGMFLVTGPTGSGKTTTLYTSLRQLDAVSDKIISIEDPVEYQVEGVTQIQVRPEIDLGFARILRSVVRHDPDVIMVGETRDGETADIAVNAALTGHLLLSTLHTNSAAGAIGRLLDMGVEPFLLASVLRGVLGQRLVAELCPHCRRPHSPTAEEEALLHRFGGKDLPPTLFASDGCDKCNGIGIVGRVGIFEMLEVDEEIRHLIRERAPSQAVQSHAMSKGMTTMFQDGIAKARAGVTTLDEVLRATEEF